MPRQHRRDHPRREYGESWEVAAYMLDGPRTPDEIADHYGSQPYLKRRQCHENQSKTVFDGIRDNRWWGRGSGRRCWQMCQVWQKMV
jgi:hypothetical protein